MNRREFNMGAMWAATASGLLVPNWGSAAVHRRQVKFSTGVDYRLRTAVRINADQEWDGSPIMSLGTPDETFWAWGINQYNEDDPVIIEMNVAYPDEHTYALYEDHLKPGPWHKFEWHVRISANEDGTLEGWWDDRKILEIGGPNCDLDYDELLYHQTDNPAVHFDRVHWTAE